ncbi:hypothetical protein CROQUDRAFT_652724, partial [Cronartium quercuum f. sp. fusiforme G11]
MKPLVHVLANHTYYYWYNKKRFDKASNSLKVYAIRKISTVVSINVVTGSSLMVGARPAKLNEEPVTPFFETTVLENLQAFSDLHS